MKISRFFRKSLTQFSCTGLNSSSFHRAKSIPWEKLKTQKLQAEQISYYIKDKIHICASIEDTLPKRIHSASSVDNQQNDSQQTRQSQPKEGKSAQTVAIEKRAECGVPKLRYISLDGKI